MKLSSTTISLIVATLLVIAASSSAQTGPLTEKEYWAETYAGYSSTRALFPRRETESYESLTAGKVEYSRTEISEYLSKDTYRSTKTTIQKGNTTIEEAIQLGRIRYCRKDGSQWTTERCYQNPPPALGPADETQFSVQRNKDGDIYLRIAAFSRKSTGSAEPIKYVTEDKLVLNKDRSARQRTLTTKVVGTNDIVSISTSKFNYNIEIKIEAPVK